MNITFQLLLIEAQVSSSAFSNHGLRCYVPLRYAIVCWFYLFLSFGNGIIIGMNNAHNGSALLVTIIPTEAAKAVDIHMTA